MSPASVHDEALQSAQAHGGRIEVDSSAAGGTEFRVHLPRSVAGAPARAGAV